MFQFGPIDLTALERIGKLVALPAVA